MSTRAGATLVEVLVALLVGLLLAVLSLELLARARTAQRNLTARAETLAAIRVARHVLRSELRVAEPGRDFTSAGDSLGLRAFRGAGAVCPDRPAPEELLVAYEGLRGPDPEKDSVLILLGDGRWWPARLLDAAPTSLACSAAPQASVQRWRLSAVPPPGAALARVFERGSYHVSGGAVRYRRGAGGRQPLTPEVLDERLSHLVSSTRRLALELVTGPVSGGSWRGFLKAR